MILDAYAGPGGWSEGLRAVGLAAMLRGPDPEKFRTSHYGARWYVDPLPADDVWPATKDKWPSVTTVKKAWSKPFRKKLPTGETVPLDAYWAAEFVIDNVEGVAALARDRDALMALICGAGERTLNRASERGNGVHDVLEALADGKRLDGLLVEPEVAPFLDACAAFVADWSPEWIATEFVVINRGLGYAGTGDAILHVDLPEHPGAIVLTDWKSRGGAHGAYEEEIAQIGGYSLAEYMVVLDDDGRPVRRELPPIDAGLIVSLTAEGYEAYPVDIDKAREAFEGMLVSWGRGRDGQKAARAARGHPLFAPASTPGNAATAPMPSVERGPRPSQVHAGEVTESPAPCSQGEGASVASPVASPERVAWVHARLMAIKDAGYGADLALKWDVELVPPPVKVDSVLTDEQVSVLAHDWCDHVEGLHDMQFGPSDPLFAAFDETPEPTTAAAVDDSAEREAAKAEARRLGDAARSLLEPLSVARTNAVLKACGMTGFETMTDDLLGRLELVMGELANSAPCLYFAEDDSVAVHDCAEGQMVDVAGGKGEARDRAARLAKRMGRVAPRSLAKAAENPLLVALVVNGAGADNPNNNQE